MHPMILTWAPQLSSRSRMRAAVGAAAGGHGAAASACTAVRPEPSRLCTSAPAPSTAATASRCCRLQATRSRWPSLPQCEWSPSDPVPGGLQMPRKLSVRHLTSKLQKEEIGSKFLLFLTATVSTKEPGEHVCQRVNRSTHSSFRVASNLRAAMQMSGSGEPHAVTTLRCHSRGSEALPP